jgi:hypothetical protein
LQRLRLRRQGIGQGGSIRQHHEGLLYVGRDLATEVRSHDLVIVGVGLRKGLLAGHELLLGALLLGLLGLRLLPLLHLIARDRSDIVVVTRKVFGLRRAGGLLALGQVRGGATQQAGHRFELALQVGTFLRPLLLALSVLAFLGTLPGRQALNTLVEIGHRDLLIGHLDIVVVTAGSLSHCRRHDFGW